MTTACIELALIPLLVFCFRCFETKVQRIRRLRKTSEWYYVTKSTGLFGDFSNTYALLGPHQDRVLARSPKEAAQRFAKRHYYRQPRAECEERWAKYRVQQANKPDHPRHQIFYR